MLQIEYIIKKRTLKHFSRWIRAEEYWKESRSLTNPVFTDGLSYEINFLDIVYFLFFYFHFLLLDYIFNLKVIYKLCCGNKRTHTFYADYFSNALYHSLNILYFSYF